MRMINPYHTALIATLVISVGCKEKKEIPGQDSRKSDYDINQNKDTLSKSDYDIEPKASVKAKVSTMDQLPPSLKEAFAEMRGDSPKIPIMLKAWSELWHGTFEQPTFDKSPSAERGETISVEANEIKTQAPDTLLRLLKDGGSLNGFERGDLIGISALLIGWANDPSLSNQLYQLFQNRSASLPQSRGDAVMAVLCDEIVPLIEPPGTLEKDDLNQWEGIARGNNPIYRHVALKIHARICNNLADRESFLMIYTQETDEAIKEEVFKQINKLEKGTRRKLLESLRNGQNSVGDLQFSERIQSLINESP